MSLSKPTTSRPTSERKIKGKVIHKQGRNIIFNVYNFLKELSSSEVREKTHFARSQELTAKACGVSVHSVSRIIAEGKESLQEAGIPSFSSPGKHRLTTKRITGFDDFKKCVLRRAIFEMYDNGEYPTVKKLVGKMKQKINFDGCNSSMRKILKDIGFKYKKTNDGRRFLMERADIVAERIKFLRKIHSLRTSGDDRPIFYLDETWVNQNHSKKDIWQDSTGRGGLGVPVGKGSRLIVCHVGSAKTGFIPESKWVFRSRKSDTDYHSEMNAQSFKDWFQNKFLNFLEEGSIIIMDNASYHSKLLNRLPTTSARVHEIKEWLEKNNVQYLPHETKMELLQRVYPFRNQPKLYELDQIAEERGHQVIRLPPYHCQYNPIELIWAKVKREVAERNNTFRLADVERLMNEALDRVTREDWVSRVARVEKLQDDDYLKEVARDETVQNLTINLMDSDSETSDEEIEEGEEEEDEELAFPL